jgi:hypothetical protein
MKKAPEQDDEEGFRRRYSARTAGTAGRRHLLVWKILRKVQVVAYFVLWKHEFAGILMWLIRMARE